MKALAIGIHVDDCECGVGGILRLLYEKGWETTVLTPSPNNLSDNIYEDSKQSKAAAKILGAEKIIFDYNLTKYFKNNEESIEKTKNTINEIKPDIIFMMHPKDHHIEHTEVSKMVREAIFRASVDGWCPNEIYSFETGAMQSMCYFNPDIYINISSVFDRLKECMLSFNQSHASGEGLAADKKIRANYRGNMAGYGIEYAEALKIIKYPDKNNDFLLKNVLNDYFRWAGTKMYYPDDELFL